MHHLLRKQIILFIILLGTGSVLKAQKEIYREDHDQWPYYFGLTLAYNKASLHTTKHEAFLLNDSIQSVEPGASGGIALGLLATLRMNPYIQLRANPQLILGGAKYFTYYLKYPDTGEQDVEKKTLPSSIVSFPFQLKFNSDRINNFRVYMMGGVKYDIDLASNSQARNAQDLVKLKKFDFGIEGGIGFNFYLPFVTVSPEIKFSNGLTNIHSRDPYLKYSSIFDKIQSRMIVFSIHLED
ncbi:MAG: protein-translocating porin PorT [Chitinophagaceae bacterium]|nr:protein-translocating porin PorT [Chitinophagaceae bacterium]